MSDREVYPNAPLRLVTAEFRFPLSPTLSGPTALATVAEDIGSRLPIVEPTAQTVQAFGGPPTPPSFHSEGYRFLSRDRMASVIVTPNRVAIETTAYEHWEGFRDSLIAPTLTSVGDRLRAIAGIERVGLRYIDEIRVPEEIGQLAEWRAWVATELVAPSTVSKFPSKSMKGRIHFQTGNSREILLNFGAMQGHAVNDTGSLNLPSPAGEGPFFLLDIDSFWTGQRELAPFDSNEAIQLADSLHAPVRALFESCITEKLRNEVLRHRRGGGR